MLRKKIEGANLKGCYEFGKKEEEKEKKMATDAKVEACLVHASHHCIRGTETFQMLTWKTTFGG
jgi:hypothetical protein